MRKLTYPISIQALAALSAVGCGGRSDTSGGSDNGQLSVASAPVVPTAITAGAFRACAAFNNGTVKCWGGDSQGTVTIPNINSATAVSCGEVHCCALLKDGRVQCWGNNGDGELGNGTTSLSNVTPPVLVSNLTTAVNVAAGEQYTCAALLDGTVECWGNNTADLMGLYGETDTRSPVAVPGITGSVAVSVNSSKVCGTCVLTSVGVVECWGPNDAQPPSPLAVMYSSDTKPATQVGVGYYFACALLSDQTVKCWGSSDDVGQLNSNVKSATYLAVGFRHSCATVASGEVRCWGSNNMGQIGSGSTASSSAPASVKGVTSATAVAAGYQFTCALLADGEVRCWGDNGSGQLGDGTSTSSNVPVTVKGL